MRLKAITLMLSPIIFCCCSTKYITQQSLSYTAADKRETQFKQIASIIKSSKKALAHLGRERLWFLQAFKRYSYQRLPATKIKNGQYYYYSENVSGFYYPVLKRTPESSPNKPELFLNFNSYLNPAFFGPIGQLRISHDNLAVAFTVLSRSSGKHILFIYFHSPRQLVLISEEDCADLRWGNNHNRLYYTITKNDRPATLYSLLLRQHKIIENKKLFHEKNPKFYLDLKSSKSGNLLILESSSVKKSYLRTYREAEGLKLLIAADGFLHAFPVNDNLIVVHKRLLSGREILELKSLNGSMISKQLWQGDCQKHLIDLAVISNSIAIITANEFKETLLLYQLTSNQWITPNLSFDFRSMHMKLLPIIDDSQRNLIISAEDYLTAPVQILIDPSNGRIIKVVQGSHPPELKDKYIRKDFIINTEHNRKIGLTFITNRKNKGKIPPVLFKVYSAYGKTLRPHFLGPYFALLKRGYALAFVNVSGSGFYGRCSHQAAMNGHKYNSIRDFLIAIKFIIDQNLSRAGKLFVYGRSAGAITAAGAILEQPELFAGAILEAPFLDPVSLMQNKHFPHTLHELQEWGDPNNKKQLNLMLKYSPLNQIKPENYPNMLIRTSLADKLVPATQALEWSRRVLNQATNKPLIVVSLKSDQSHTGPERVSRDLYELAENFAFMLSCLNTL
ncbi:MAG: hypothetical protein D6719_03285 [Candidatus Dadabacteria bacterium]|nr:MAG: hypothetical protein D6719_03285 [Candidatus Dadabacteria bacterium]